MKSRSHFRNVCSILLPKLTSCHNSHVVIYFCPVYSLEWWLRLNWCIIPHMTPFLHCTLLWYIYHAHNSSGPYFCCPLPDSKQYISSAHHWLPQSHNRQAAWNITVHSGRSNYRHSMVSGLSQVSGLKLHILGLFSPFQHSATTICTTFKNSTFCPHSLCMCFVWVWEQTAIISLYSVDWLVFITETECVYCAVRSAHTVCLCVLCGSKNKERLFHCTALTGWFL